MTLFFSSEDTDDKVIEQLEEFIAKHKEAQEAERKRREAVAEEGRKLREEMREGKAGKAFFLSRVPEARRGESIAEVKVLKKRAERKGKDPLHYLNLSFENFREGKCVYTDLPGGKDGGTEKSESLLIPFFPFPISFPI